MIKLLESESTRKLIDVTATSSATGAHFTGAVEWYAGGHAERYEIDVDVPCIYSDDARYRVALCMTPPRLVLVEDDGQPADELCYLARWSFTKATDTCAGVVIEVPRRVLVPEPSQFVERPVFETRNKMRPCYDCDGVGRVALPDGSETHCSTCEGIELSVPELDIDTGMPVFEQVQVGTETIEIPPEPLPIPAVHLVTSCDLPVATPARTESRKRRKRERVLLGEIRALLESGKTYAMMTVDERAKYIEVLVLRGDLPWK